MIISSHDVFEEIQYVVVRTRRTASHTQYAIELVQIEGQPIPASLNGGSHLTLHTQTI